MSNQQKSKNHQAEGRAAAGIAKAIREHAAATRPEPSQELKDRNRKHQRVQWAAVAVAAIYAGLTYFLLRTTRDAVGLTREQVHIGQRAYLSVLKANLPELPTPGKGIQVDYTIENTGQTPALNVVPISGLGIFTGGPPPAQALEPVPRSGDIGAGKTFDFYTIHVNPLTQEDVINLSKPLVSIRGNVLTPLGRAPRLYFYGVIKYVDVFGGQNETEFCLVYLPPSMHSGGKMFSYCNADRNRMK